MVSSRVSVLPAGVPAVSASQSSTRACAARAAVSRGAAVTRCASEPTDDGATEFIALDLRIGLELGTPQAPDPAPISANLSDVMPAKAGIQPVGWAKARNPLNVPRSR